MGALRSSYKSAEDGLFMVFSNGTLLQYPTFTRASNGFVRGPKGEQCGRGDAGTARAQEMCKTYINQYIEQFQKFGHKMIGLTAPLDLRMRWINLSEFPWPEKDPAPGDITVTAKCYWQDHPETFEIHRWERHTYGTSGRVDHYRITTPYRRTGSFTDLGLIKEYHEDSDLVKLIRVGDKTQLIPVRETLKDLADQLAEFVDTNDYVRVEWKLSGDVNDLIARLLKAYEAKEIIERVANLLPDVSQFYEELGYAVELYYDYGADGGATPYLKIQADEHTVLLAPSKTQIICKLERDEERLAAIHKARLAEELRASLETHGDIRDAELD